MSPCAACIANFWGISAGNACKHSPNCWESAAAGWPDFLAHIFVVTDIVLTHLIQTERRNTMSVTMTVPQATTTWNLDPVHSVAEFKVKHMMISNVKGQF